MSLGEILGIVGIVVGIVAIITGVLAARRWGNRRRRLMFEFRSAPLIAAGSPDRSGLLKVTFRDIEVPDPHLLTIRLANVGPADIATDRFDAGRPLVIRLNCTMYGLTATSHPDAITSTAVGAEGVIQLRPQLLCRGEERTIEAVVSGASDPELDSPLIDTDIVSGPAYAAELARGLGSVLADAALRGLLRV
jgi:hypothetical protein